MGLLSLFTKSSTPNLIRLPSGSFTILPDGRIVASTLPQSFPTSHVKEIGKQVLAAFQSARSSSLPLTEIIVEYSSLKLTAKEMRGGAMIFLAPRDLTQK